MKQVYRNLIFLCLFFVIIGSIWHLTPLKTYLHFSAIKEHQYFLECAIMRRPVACAASYILIFFILTVSALPVTLALITVGGFLFGTILGSLYTVIGVLLSSFFVFKLSKKLFGDALQESYRPELQKFNNNVARYGFYYLISVRVVPIIPFFMVNLVAGLTAIDSKTFVVSTLLGGLPTIIIFSYLGSQCAWLIVNC